jgi:tetratricopeptide (TPR) repeat protein
MFLGLSEARAAIGKAEIDHLNGNETAAHDAIVDSLSRLSNVKGNNVGVERYLAGVRVDAQLLRVDIEMSLKNFEAAEQSANAAVDIAKHLPIGRVVDRENVAQPAIYEAIALARLGKNVEASRALAPALALHRDLYRRNHDFEKQRFDYAIALYADALADPSHRAASLNESARILRELPVAMQALMNVKRWQQRVAVERAPH